MLIVLLNAYIYVPLVVFRRKYIPLASMVIGAQIAQWTETLSKCVLK